MSEYQYYEFLAVDRPLTPDEMDELRFVSSRAEITPTSFTNTYNWGNLRADPIELLANYFDVFVYLTNWGTRRIAFRFPKDALDLAAVEDYLSDDLITVRRAGEHVILDICMESEEPEYMNEESGWMASLASVRAELLSGDLRALYLLWLASLCNTWEEDLDLEETEPPVPPGLSAPSAGLTALAEFMLLDDPLVVVAGEGSPKEAELQEGQRLARWIEALPGTEKDRLLLSVVEGQAAQVGTSLLRRYRAEVAKHNRGPSRRRRTIGELLDAVKQQREKQQREEQQREEEKRRREQAAAEAAKQKRLDALVGTEETVWQDVERLIATKQPNAYDKAVVLLVNLRDLAVREGCSGQFEARLGALGQAQARKGTFIKRLQKAGLF